MALPVTDVQGTKAYLAPEGTSVVDAAAIVVAIAAGVQIGCLQAIGSIEMSRAMQEYTCISSDESSKSQGSVSLGNQVISTLFNAADVAGQQDLIAMWDNKERRVLIIELDDQITPTTGNPTYITYNVFVSNVSIGMEKDNAVMYDPTLEISSLPDMTLAT